MRKIRTSKFISQSPAIINMPTARLQNKHNSKNNLMGICFLLELILISSSHVHPLCQNSERRALLRFKDNFIINNTTMDFAYPKTKKWHFQGVDCCSWEGVECDPVTGHVIGLDLSSSGLHGSIDSNSSLFNLVHLQKLNLALNNFNYSSIPRQLGNFSRLVYLNLSASFFSGKIPSEIAKLSKLSTLDLSNFYVNQTGKSFLEIERPRGLERLIQNCTNLQYLRLSAVKIDSDVPHILANFSKLRHLKLTCCRLRGQFPEFVFRLPNLQVLYLQGNPSLTGCLPEFHSSMPLKELAVGMTLFYGKIPASLGNLDSLQLLLADACNFWGIIPNSLQNLTQLDTLDLSFNSFCGHFPSWITNLTQLASLAVSYNLLQGGIPSSISRLRNLETFSAEYNQLKGVEIDTFLELKHLKILGLSGHNLSVLTEDDTSHNDAPSFKMLFLADCNLTKFPNFLKDQDQLEALDLSGNNIHGKIPKWIWEVSNKTLFDLNLCQNNLVSNFPEAQFVLHHPNLVFLDLSSNLLRGSIPVPLSFSMIDYSVSDNSFDGQIPQQFCNWNSLRVLDLSHNNFSGVIPECLANSSKALEILNLQGNNFHGPIPQGWRSGSIVKLIALGQNKLQGKVPRSLIECKMLELLDLGGNEIKDRFPSWLGSLPELKILILSSNKLYGGINNQEYNSTFPKLRIVDLSSNNLSGGLSTMYFKSWAAMKVDDYGEHLAYLQANDYLKSYADGMLYLTYYNYSITLENKGIRLDYRKIPEAFAGIDLSCNRFEGRIPESVRWLSGLRLLNLSNNFLSGEIPSSLANLTKLEALDLSQNKLMGQIPPQLTQLNFLEVFNVSYNQLTGPIPKGQQFETFPSSSFDGNPGLCGSTLTKHCKDQEANPPSLPTSGEDSGRGGEVIAWEGVVMGYGTGFLLGLLFTQPTFTRRMHRWFNT